jgi:NitT/TauT family transport system permease protein
MGKLVRALAPFLLIGLLLLAWELACRLLKVPIYFLPAPSEVVRAAMDDPLSLLGAAWHTFEMAMLALLVVSAVGTGLALAVAGNPTLEEAVRPLAVTVQVTPVIAIAPLALIWAGLDHPERAIIALAAIVAFFPIFSGALTGLKSADPDLERLFDLYGAGRFQKLFRLRLPSAVPFILEGHKVAAGQAIIGAVVAEFVAQSGAAQGLAWRILEAGQRLQTARMFAALFALALMGAAVFGLMTIFERFSLKWWRGR